MEKSKRACGWKNAKEEDGEGGRAVEETAKCQVSLIKQTHEEKEPLKGQAPPPPKKNTFHPYYVQNNLFFLSDHKNRNCGEYTGVFSYTEREFQASKQTFKVS